MQRLVPKNIPRYECLVEASQRFPELEPSACQAYLSLIRTSDEVWRHMNSHYGEHNTSQGRFLVMMLLLEKPGCESGGPRTPAELADMAQVSRATITGLLDTLERDGYVKRQPDERDRRMITVHLTPEGIAFMNSVLPNHFRCITRLMSPLNADELQTLTSLLSKLVQHACESTSDSHKQSLSQ